MFDYDTEKIDDWKEQQINRICFEEEQAGGFEKWYNDLHNFRRYIRKKYICYGIDGHVYREKRILLPTGDIIDHHAISYLAPLDFKRVGWGHRRMTPAQQISSLGGVFKGHGTRFIYVALPNKCNIMPEMICDDPNLYASLPNNAVTYRKYLRDTMEYGIEVLDLLPVFQNVKEKQSLFTKGHMISSIGARLVAEKISEYLESTTSGIEPNFAVSRSELYMYGNVDIPKESDINLYNICQICQNGKQYVIWNQEKDKGDIALFGDCNLQAHSAYGAGIGANLAYAMQYPVYDAGRKLIFGFNESPITMNDIKKLCNYKIVIYIAFASAPWVRSARLIRHYPALEYKWCHFEI